MLAALAAELGGYAFVRPGDWREYFGMMNLPG